MRAVLIVNPASGAGGDAAALEAGLRARGADVVSLGLEELRGTPDTRTAGAERVIVAGGDGSLGPAAALAAELGVPLGVVPIGTANDLARELGLPRGDVEAALDVATGGRGRRAIDVARAGGVPFLNAAAAGLSVHATRRAVPLKRWLGPLAYAAGALHAGLRAHPVRVRVTADGAPVFTGRAWQVIVAGTGAFGAGSSVDVAQPGALDVAVLVAGPRRALVRRAYGMRAGGLTEQDGVLHARGREVVVDGPLRFNVDGDVRPVPGGRFTVDGRVEVVTG